MSMFGPLVSLIKQEVKSRRHVSEKRRVNKKKKKRTI